MLSSLITTSHSGARPTIVRPSHKGYSWVRSCCLTMRTNMSGYAATSGGGGIIAGTAPVHNEVVFDADRLHPYAPRERTHDQRRFVHVGARDLRARGRRRHGRTQRGRGRVAARARRDPGVSHEELVER